MSDTENQDGRADVLRKMTEHWAGDPTNEKPTAPVGCTDLLAALRMQMHQLEMTMSYGGPSEICGALDAVDNAVDELRNKVSG